MIVTECCKHDTGNGFENSETKVSDQFPSQHQCGHSNEFQILKKNCIIIYCAKSAITTIDMRDVGGYRLIFDLSDLLAHILVVFADDIEREHSANC